MFLLFLSTPVTGKETLNATVQAPALMRYNGQLPPIKCQHKGVFNLRHKCQYYQILNF